VSKAIIDLLGRTVRDKVTGFRGVVSSVSFDLYGCIQAAVSPPVNDKGEIPDGRWFDVHRLAVLDEPRAMPVPAFAASPADHDRGPAPKPGSPR
jgi:hypothetical protein